MPWRPRPQACREGSAATSVAAADAHRVDVLHLPRGVMQERERARLDQHVVVVRRAAQEGRTETAHLVAHAEAEAVDEEAP